jgi:hypothetical protein
MSLLDIGLYEFPTNQLVGNLYPFKNGCSVPAVGGARLQLGGYQQRQLA